MDKFYSITGGFVYTGELQPGDRIATAEDIAAYTSGKDVLFKAACAQFRAICAEIGAAIGNADFRGGFDEYAAFINSDYAKSKPGETALLAAMWSGANEYAKYEGAKIGLGQPAWWYKCWEK